MRYQWLVHSSNAVGMPSPRPMIEGVVAENTPVMQGTINVPLSQSSRPEYRIRPFTW